MDETADKFRVEIDYEKQSFEDLNGNLYEISVATSRYAREINDKMRKFFGSEINVQPRNLAMKKLQNKEVKFIYTDKENINKTTEKKD